MSTRWSFRAGSWAGPATWDANMLRITGNLGQAIIAFDAVARRNGTAVLQGVTSRIVSEIARRNHVITGRMVGNWNVAINGADMSYDENRKDPTGSGMKGRNLPIT